MSYTDSKSDARVRFLFEDVPVRGAWVCLQTSLAAMPAMKMTTTIGKQLLGESVVATVLLSANIKLQGRLAVQARGDGALRLLVAESTQDAGVRGVVEWNETTVSADAMPTLKRLIGNGYLAVTLLPDVGDSYQGIVPLQGNHLQDCLADYFKQSEQVETALWLACDGERAAGLLLQALPGMSAHDGQWQHLHALAETVSDSELLSLSCEQLLYRLFHQERVRVFDEEPVSFQCSCNAERSAAALATLGKEDLQQLFTEQPSVVVDCQFCGAVYRYSERDIGNILGETPPVLH